MLYRYTTDEYFAKDMILIGKLGGVSEIPFNIFNIFNTLPLLSQFCLHYFSRPFLFTGPDAVLFHYFLHTRIWVSTSSGLPAYILEACE